jgi:hypothetical protein
MDQELYAAKKPTSTVQEFDAYVYPKGQDGKADKEEPVKVNDDGLDAARYAAMHLDGASAARGAFVVRVADEPAGILPTKPTAPTPAEAEPRYWA